MAENHTITVEIVSGEGVKVPPTEVNEAKKPTQPKKRKERSPWKKIQTGVIAFGTAQATQAVYGSLSRVGTYTGDYIRQNSINNVMALTSFLNPVGFAFKIMDENLNRAQSNYAAEQLRSLTNTTANGSRYSGRKI